MTQDVSHPDQTGSLTRRAIPAAVVVVGAVAGFGTAWSHRAGAGPGANAADSGSYGGGAGGDPLATLDQIPAGGGLINQNGNFVFTRER